MEEKNPLLSEYCILYVEMNGRHSIKETRVSRELMFFQSCTTEKMLT